MSAGHHDDKNNSIFKITLNLTMACLVSGIIIAGLFYVTNPIAVQKAIELKNDAMKALVKDADKFEEIEVHGKEGWYKAEKGGKIIAYVVPSEKKGFGGPIKMLVAVTPDGKVINYDIIAHLETPGLGDKANIDPFKSQLKGKTADKLEVVKDPSKTENIQAMTGATITSRAVTNAVKQAVEEVAEFTGGK